MEVTYFQKMYDLIIVLYLNKFFINLNEEFYQNNQNLHFSKFPNFSKSKSSLIPFSKIQNSKFSTRPTCQPSFIVFRLANIQRCWCSSVGRAWDWRSQGRWFDPGHQHFLIFTYQSTHHLTKRMDLKIKPDFDFKIKKISPCVIRTHVKRVKASCTNRLY